MQPDGDRFFGFVAPMPCLLNRLPRNFKNLFKITKARSPRIATGGDPHRWSKQITSVFVNEDDGFVSTNGEIAVGGPGVSSNDMGCIASQISPFLIFTCFVEGAVRAENSPYIETSALNDLCFSWAAPPTKSLTGGFIQCRERGGNESFVSQFLCQLQAGFMRGQQRDALSGRPHRSKISSRFAGSGWRAVRS